MAKQSSRPYSEDMNSSINIISEGTQIKGDIISNSDIRIDGELFGNLSSKGRLVVGPKGKIEGEVNCSTVEVAGKITGKVKATELLNMKSSSQIEGEIKAGKLSVEPGAVFTGTCTMGNGSPNPVDEKTTR